MPPGLLTVLQHAPQVASDDCDATTLRGHHLATSSAAVLTGPAQQETALCLLLMLLHLATHHTTMQHSSVTVAAGARSAHEVEASKRRIARWGTDQEEGQAFLVCCCVASVGYVLKVRIQYKLHALGRWGSSPVGG